MNDPPSENAELARRREAAAERLRGRIDYERSATLPDRGRGLKLDRMRELAARLGNPQDQLRIIHIAGTKGKGSTSAMIAGALSAAGLRTGLFTSPHLDTVEQRLALDGAACGAAEFVALVDQIWPAVTAMDAQGAGRGPTYFEITTAMAMLHFANRGADAAVLEVGMGGRLDSTNICTPTVAVVTNISFDHMQQLGATLAEIAGEKAGIIKPGVPVVSGVIAPEPRDVIRQTAARRGCTLSELGRDFEFEYTSPQWVGEKLGPAAIDFIAKRPGGAGDLRQVQLGLIGRHQGANAAVALATLAELQRQGWRLPEQAIRSGLAGCRLPARVEIVCSRPTVIIDAAHNVASAEALAATLAESFGAGAAGVARRTLVLSCSRDKDLRGMLAVLAPHFDEMVLTCYRENPRAAPAEQLDALAAEAGHRARQVIADPAAAWEHVRQTAAADDLVCITGSFFIAAEMRRLIAARPISCVTSVS